MFKSPAGIHFYQLTNDFLAHKNKEEAKAMAAYMKNLFPFLGIKSVPRRKLFKNFVAEFGWPDVAEVDALVKELWQKEEREYQYLALDLLEWRFKKVILPKDALLLEYLVTTKSWWDTVDSIASKLSGAYFKHYPEQIGPYAEKWINSSNMWLNRMAILYQLKYKKDTDEFRLFSYCLQWSGSNEFFHQKAIGWSLREYSKTEPMAVKKFVEGHTLKPLSKREALKWMQKNVPELV